MSEASENSKSHKNIDENGIDSLNAYWALPEKTRKSFIVGRHIGRIATTSALLTGLFVATTAAALPLWALWTAGAIGASIILANGLGMLVDADKHCQGLVGKIAAEKPALKNARYGFLKEGLKAGLLQPLKKLPLAIIGTPFWPAVLVIGPLVNKGTAGYYFFKPSRKQAEAEREKNQQPFACDQNITKMPSEITGKFNTPQPSTPPKDWTPPHWPNSPKP